MTSMIPFFLLLLTAYTFSAPIGQESENSTGEYQFSTGQTTINTDFNFNDLSTGSPIIQNARSVEYLKTNEAESNEKRESQESVISTSTSGYKKRSDAAYLDSAESESNEKRESQESVISTSTSGYKKRSDSESQESVESASNEKRESQESVISTSTNGYKKRSDSESQESVESASNEKRESQESVISTSTSGYKKRSDSESQESAESASNEKRESQESVLPTSTKDYKKRSDASSEESIESESNEKRAASQYSVPTSTRGYKKITPKSYGFTTLESSATFNQRAIPVSDSEEGPQSASAYPQKQMTMKNNAYPSSSVNSFGKTTGLLNNRPVGQSSEESQRQFPIQSQKSTNTVSVIPGKVSQTKFVRNNPTKFSTTMQPNQQQQQLSQGQSQSQF